MSWPDIRAIRGRQKKGRPGRRRRLKGERGPGDAGEGEAADLRDDPAGRRGRDPDAGERQAGDDRPADRADDRPGDVSTPTNTTSTAGWPSGATATRRSAMRRGSTPGTTTGMGSARFMSTRWRGSGRCCGRWLRPHRGISQENLPLYLGFFEFVHNVRARGKSVAGVVDRPLGGTTPESRMSLCGLCDLCGGSPGRLLATPGGLRSAWRSRERQIEEVAGREPEAARPRSTATVRRAVILSSGRLAPGGGRAADGRA